MFVGESFVNHIHAAAGFASAAAGFASAAPAAAASLSPRYSSKLICTCVGDKDRPRTIKEASRWPPQNKQHNKPNTQPQSKRKNQRNKKHLAILVRVNFSEKRLDVFILASVSIGFGSQRLKLLSAVGERDGTA